MWCGVGDVVWCCVVLCCVVLCGIVWCSGVWPAEALLPDGRVVCLNARCAYYVVHLWQRAVRLSGAGRLLPSATGRLLPSATLGRGGVGWGGVQFAFFRIFRIFFIFRASLCQCDVQEETF